MTLPTLKAGTFGLSGDRPSALSQNLAPYGDRIEFNASRSLNVGCHVCNEQTGLSRCGACRVVQYCSREHQTNDRPVHKTICNRIKKGRQDLAQAEQKLRREEGDEIFQDGPRGGRGHFWGILETRDYMRVRFALVESLNKVNTKLAVQESLDTLLDMLQLCRSDNMGVRDLVPAKFLRLGMDQECYDFCKWWATTGQDSEYNRGDTENPYLEIRDADLFEPVERFTGNTLQLSQNIALTLLKIRLLIDQQSKQGSPELIKRLEKEIKQLYDAVEKGNKHVWPALLKPGDHLTARPQMYTLGSVPQMELMLQYNYNAWAETPGAIDVIETLLKN